MMVLFSLKHHSAIHAAKNAAPQRMIGSQIRYRLVWLAKKVDELWCLEPIRQTDSFVCRFISTIIYLEKISTEDIGFLHFLLQIYMPFYFNLISVDNCLKLFPLFLKEPRSFHNPLRLPLVIRNLQIKLCNEIIT